MKYKFETDDKDEALRITHSLDMALALHSFDNWLRAQIKYQDRDLQDIRDELHNELTERGVYLDDILK